MARKPGAGTASPQTAPQKPKGDVRPLFPAAAVARYKNEAHQDVPLDGLAWAPNYGSVTESTPQDLNILDEERFAKVRAFVEDCVADYLDNVMAYEYESFSIVHSWVNRAPEGGYQRMHFHGNSIVSGVYYLKATRENAPLMFQKAEINTQPYLAVASKQQTIFTANQAAFPTETGMTFLFPSQIRHGYEMPNKGGERISLAFNVMLTGIGLFYRV